MSKMSNILLIHDQPTEVLHLCLMFEALDFPAVLNVVATPMEALNLLKHDGCGWKSPQPDLVLVHLGLSKGVGEGLLDLLLQNFPHLLIGAVIPYGMSMQNTRGQVQLSAPISQKKLQGFLTVLKGQQQLGA
ncbi:response regulator [Deinococcus hopiensis]|uniref:Response regulatory domain-containing protein n=1 Tax=Deinococcus hopiensis KR-140 TaxID=695939 RepID=A0A1W1V0G9_9DEIO|nr:response regulator [Deinococcus hopiensis]SMB86504.1 hypothetical protein SAMN00790413_03832 [Deinococcus hopiensis KR-140]